MTKKERKKVIIETTITEEGGSVNDRFDPGKGTVCGISSKSFPREYLQAMSIYRTEGLEATKRFAVYFYAKNFWSYLYDEIEDSTLLQQLFDFGVNAGKQTAVFLLQKTLNKLYSTGLTLDGAFGNVTLNAVNRFSKESKKGEPESILHNEYELTIASWYRERKMFWRFKNGWLRRLFHIFNWEG
ncbi:MAG: hypothetical protein AUJ54_06615 [Ignavibacteria bacterium CG1_02_37_35]|nr:MAG: hypothetical protein AUJ54_06615 [Ignavibacteria bacterium CG1_02_37_35]